MQAFEVMATSLLAQEGYWVRQSYKVELTKDEKQQIGRRSSPRWELDLVAYKPGTNELLIVECKGYQDSTGTTANSFKCPSTDRYKLFNDPKLRKVVFGRLKEQMYEQGLVPAKPSVKLALFTAKIRKSDRQEVREIFERNNWMLFDAVWIRDRLNRISETSYENEVVAVVAKQLLRGEDG